MKDEENERMLDLLCDKYVYGLSEEEAKELERLGFDPQDAESIERTVAALGLVDADAEAQMPASLQSKLMRSADEFFGAAAADEDPVPQRQIVLDGGSGRSGWFNWMGWAVAAAACIALAVTMFIPRGPNISRLQTPTPTPVETLTPAQERQRLIETSGPELVRADWVAGKMPNINVSGDVVWSEEKQAGYMRLKGLPKNDPSRESYQLWIVDAAQDPKTPIDGGVFDITAEGEVIIPIDAKIRVRDPKAFAITMERPGGVPVSKQEKVPALAPVKPNQS